MTVDFGFSPWVFYEDEALIFDLNASGLPERPYLQIELWAYGLLKSALEGVITVSLTMIKAMVGDLEVQREHRFWFPVVGEEKPCSVRVGLEIGRSDSSILSHVQEGIARLARAKKGNEEESGLSRKKGGWGGKKGVFHCPFFF